MARIARLTVLLAMISLPLPGQSVIPAKAGLISYIEGKVFVDDRVVEASDAHWAGVRENEAMRTERGRAEVLVGPCTALRIGDNSSFRLVSNQLTEARIDLLAGFAVVDAVAMAHDTKLTFAVNAALVTITIAGFYHFDFAPPLIKAFAGRARVSWANQNFEVSAGKALALDAAAPLEKIDKNALDPLDNWSKARARVLAAQRARHPDRSVQTLDAAAAAAAGAPERPGDRDTPRFETGATNRFPAPSPLPDSSNHLSGGCGAGHF